MEKPYGFMRFGDGDEATQVNGCGLRATGANKTGEV
jgi:hypothetical protein